MWGGGGAGVERWGCNVCAVASVADKKKNECDVREFTPILLQKNYTSGKYLQVIFEKCI